MAIAFVATGATVAVNTASSGHSTAVPLPVGYAAGELLLMTVTTDSVTGPTTPTGWQRLFGIQVGTPTDTPYAPYPTTTVYYKIATGSEGVSVVVPTPSATWPAGSPYMIAVVVAYSGTDQTSPIGEWSTASTVSPAASQAHPIITTSVTGEWLVTIRAVSTNNHAPTFTVSGGTNAERADFTDGFNELAMAVYDSNGSLTAGAQTQRTTLASTIADFGSNLISLALRVPTPSVALAPLATAVGTAYDAFVQTVNGPWELCATMPRYTFAVDWSGDGSLTLPGAVLNADPYFSSLTNWSAANATIALSTDLASVAGTTLKLTTAAGSAPHARAELDTVVAGNSYQVRAWLYAPAAIPNNVQVNINWYSPGPTIISTSSSTSQTMVPGQWTLFDATFTAPPTAVFGAALFTVTGTPGAGYVLYADSSILADPAAAGSYSNPSPVDDVTQDILDGGVSIAYGRDDSRQLSPPKIGNASFALINKDRVYSPENENGPLFGDLDPARECRGTAVFAGVTYPLMFQRVDDYTVHADMDNRTVDFTFLDGLNLLSGFILSTDVQSGQRTGALINYVLDLVGWTGGRDIDPGATVVPWWWVEGTDAMTAVNDLVKSDGPPAVAYVAPDNTFVFRDRHHRLLDERSVNVQATFSGTKLMDCTSAAVTGMEFTAPFDYETGWKNIVNSVAFTVSERAPDTVLEAVWSSDAAITLSTGQTATITASGGDPFIDAVIPVSGTDYVLTGAGVAQIQMSRDSGQAVVLTILAIGAPITITGLQLRARSIAVRNTVTVTATDAGSIASHGQKSYTDTAPWAGSNDAFAVAESILLHYAKRRPTVSLRIAAKNGAHLVQILSRTISDRIHIVNGEMGIDDDFFIENVSHSINRMNNENSQPPVHSVIFGCEKEVFVTANPFRFDTRGAGFDQGVFDQTGSSDPATVFVFGDVTRGVFDFGTFGL